MDDVRAFLAQVPPGASALRIQRFKRHTIGSIVGDVIHPAADVIEDDRPPGRRLTWCDATGRKLAELVLHPAPDGIERVLLPMCMHAAAAVPAEVQLWCESGTLLDPERMMERWDPRDPLGRRAESLATLRDGELDPVRRAAAETLTRHGWSVRSAAGTVEAERAWRKGASPWLLTFVPVLIFLGLPLWILRMWPDLFARVGEVWRAATRGSSSRLRYEIAPSGLVVRVSRDGVEDAPIELPREAIGALSFAPSGVVYVSPDDPGSLRAIHADGCTSLPHAALGLSRTSASAAADREVGAALKELIRASIAPGP